MPKQGKQNDDRQGDTDQPEKQSTSKAHCYLHCLNRTHNDVFSWQFRYAHPVGTKSHQIGNANQVRAKSLLAEESAAMPCN
jgi:hypothetical protein